MPPPSAPARVAPTVPSSARRGTLDPRQRGLAPGVASLQHGVTGSLGDVTRYLSGPALGHTGAAAVAHAIDLGAGTTIAALGPSALSDVKHPIAAAQAIKKRGLVGTNEAAMGLTERFSKLGTVGAIPTNFRIPSVDLVAPAGAAVPKGAITADEFKKLEAQGYDLKPSLKKRFTAAALKNGHTPADIDGISGGALIDAAFSKPASTPLRVLGGFAGDLAQLGTIPAGIEGAGRMIAGGHGLEVGKALATGLYSQLPVVGKHPFLDTLQAHPFQAVTQFAGLGKTAGEAGRIGAAERGLREVESANSHLKLSRGQLSKNAYTATGQLVNDKLTAQIPFLGKRAEAAEVDRIVREASNKHAVPYVAAQHAYKDALHTVGHKRAEQLLALQQSGGKPEQIAAFFRAQGDKSNAKFYDDVAASTKNLTPEDQALLDSHAAIAQHTSQSKITAGKFGETAAKFRRYSQLIRSAAHAGDQNADRILGLRDEYLNHSHDLNDEELAALEGAYAHGIDEFATQHVASGGTEPAYVAYGKAKPLVASPFTPGPGAPIAFKDARGRQKAETGATFESGKYLVDANSPLIDSVRAQREHLASVLKSEVAEAVGAPARGREIVPPGHVFVSDTNLRAVRRTISDMEDNPVSATDYYQEDHSFRQSLHDALSQNTTPTGHRVPPGEKGHFIPTGSHKRILDHTRPPSRNQYDRFLRQYQRVLVSYRPSTIVNNTVGSIPLALTAGAGPKSFKRAFDAMRDPSLGPAIARGHGVAGSLAPNAKSHVGAKLDFMRGLSARGEDFSRLASFFAGGGRALSKNAKALNMSVDDYQRALAKGELHPELLDKMLDHMEAFTSDVLKPDGRIGRFAGHTILFHRWIGHIAKLLLKTLPVDHPRRLAVLQDLAAYGDEYRQEHGVWPDWYRAYLPLFQHVERIGRMGIPQTFTRTFNSQGVNPFSSLNNFADPISTNESVKNIALGIAAPPIQILGNTFFNRPKDSTNPLKYAIGQVGRQIPGVSVVHPMSGTSSDSIPFIDEHPKQYAGTRKGTHLPADFRPTPRPLGGIEGALARYFLGGVYDVPAQGPVHNIEVKKHIGADIAAKRKRDHGN